MPLVEFFRDTLLHVHLMCKKRKAESWRPMTGSHLWCKRVLEGGVTASVAPLDEPYVQAYPSAFSGLLVEESLTLAECYGASTP
jgi:hypothetical protein